MQINIRESDATLATVVERVQAGEEVILSNNGEPVAKVIPFKNRTLFDRLQGFIGVLDSGEHVKGGANMSQNLSQKFASAMVEKHRKLKP